MDSAVRCSLIVVPAVFVGLLSGSATQLRAQDTLDDPSPRRGVQLGLFSLGVRGGVDLEQSGQALVGASADVGYAFTPRVRFRVVGELGFAPSPNSYVGSVEMVFRFTPDSTIAVPYFGTGVGVVGNEACGADPECPALWWQFVLGFELRLHRSARWFLEYHPQDAFRRQRLLAGITMRPGGM